MARTLPDRRPPGTSKLPPRPHHDTQGHGQPPPPTRTPPRHRPAPRRDGQPTRRQPTRRIDCAFAGSQRGCHRAAFARCGPTEPPALAGEPPSRQRSLGNRRVAFARWVPSGALAARRLTRRTGYAAPEGRWPRCRLRLPRHHPAPPGAARCRPVPWREGDRRGGAGACRLKLTRAPPGGLRPVGHRRVSPGAVAVRRLARGAAVRASRKGAGAGGSSSPTAAPPGALAIQPPTRGAPCAPPGRVRAPLGRLRPLGHQAGAVWCGGWRVGRRARRRKALRRRGRAGRGRRGGPVRGRPRRSPGAPRPAPAPSARRRARRHAVGAPSSVGAPPGGVLVWWCGERVCAAGVGVAGLFSPAGQRWVCSGVLVAGVGVVLAVGVVGGWRVGVGG